MGYERLRSKYLFENFLYNYVDQSDCMVMIGYEIIHYFNIEVDILGVLYSADLIEPKESYGR